MGPWCACNYPILYLQGGACGILESTKKEYWVLYLFSFRCTQHSIFCLGRHSYAIFNWDIDNNSTRLTNSTKAKIQVMPDITKSYIKGNVWGCGSAQLRIIMFIHIQLAKEKSCLITWRAHDAREGQHLIEYRMK